LASSPGPGKRPTSERPRATSSLGEFVVERRRQRFLGDCVDNVRRNDDDPVAVSDDDVAGIDGDAATGDRQVEVRRLMDDPARR